jgi:hypothetical protein
MRELAMSASENRDPARGDDKKKRSDSQGRPAGEYDVFIRNRLFPEAASVFTFQPQSLHEIKDSCVVVLDTNVLLFPYGTSPLSLQEIGDCYRKLIQQGRLFVPGQVAREFAMNRPNKIAEIAQTFNDLKSKLAVEERSYPLLSDLDEYKIFLKARDEANKHQRACGKAIGPIVECIRKWYWNDPVSELYRELFSAKVVFDPFGDKDNERLRADLSDRVTHNRPPGYKDKAKTDGGIGDVLIWHTIMKLGEQEKRSLIFVSGEEKADWFYSVHKKALFPRYELVDCIGSARTGSLPSRV